MLVGVAINGACTWLCGKWAINCFKVRATNIGWLCLVGSSYNLALVMKYVTEAV